MELHLMINSDRGVIILQQCWNKFEEIPHVQGQREPQKDGKRGEIAFRIKPHTQMLRGLKQTLCAPGPRDPTETETHLYLSVSGGGS